MPLQGENVLLRVFLDTTRKWHHAPVYEALVEEARRRQMAGATVLEGLEGYSQDGRLFRDSPWHLAPGHEVIVEIVDTQDKIDRFLEAMEPLLAGTLVMLERAHVVFLRPKDTP